MKLFKIWIPKNTSQEVTITESYTLRWEIQGEGYKTKVQHKAFLSKKDAEIYEKELISSANFLGTWVDTKITPNH